VTKRKQDAQRASEPYPDFFVVKRAALDVLNDLARQAAVTTLIRGQKVTKEEALHIVEQDMGFISYVSESTAERYPYLALEYAEERRTDSETRAEAVGSWRSGSPFPAPTFVA